MKKIRLALAGGAVAVAGLAPLAPSAQAVTCHPDFALVCGTVGLVCRTISDLPKVAAECVQLG